MAATLATSFWSQRPIGTLQASGARQIVYFDECVALTNDIWLRTVDAALADRIAKACSFCLLQRKQALLAGIIPGSSRANANDRLPRASFGRVEGGDGIVEGRDGSYVRPQSSVPRSLDDLTQLGTIGLDN